MLERLDFTNEGLGRGIFFKRWAGSCWIYTIRYSAKGRMVGIGRGGRDNGLWQVYQRAGEETQGWRGRWRETERRIARPTRRAGRGYIVFLLVFNTCETY